MIPAQNNFEMKSSVKWTSSFEYIFRGVFVVDAFVVFRGAAHEYGVKRTFRDDIIAMRKAHG